MRAIYACNDCDWAGPHPSWSDTSDVELYTSTGGTTVMQNRHIPICPQCFSEKLEILMGNAQ